MRAIAGFLAGIVIACQALALDLGSLSNADAARGLKDALTQGSAAAVSKLRAENGFLGNDKVRIPLPDALKRVEGALRMLGMQKQADELVTAMNRAAEQARIENYVTQKTLDGLFLMIAEQEKAIRNDPIGAATGMAKKVFGLLVK
jgi:nitrous oxidase accessory protein NosD